jgi:hypothetical protein
MRRLSSGLGLASAVAMLSMAGLATDFPSATYRPSRRYRHDSPEPIGKRWRGSDRSKKQFLIKGIRP